MGSREKRRIYPWSNESRQPPERAGGSLAASNHPGAVQTELVAAEIATRLELNPKTVARHLEKYSQEETSNSGGHKLEQEIAEKCRMLGIRQDPYRHCDEGGEVSAIPSRDKCLGAIDERIDGIVFYELGQRGQLEFWIANLWAAGRKSGHILASDNLANQRKMLAARKLREQIQLLAQRACRRSKSQGCLGLVATVGRHLRRVGKSQP